MDLDSFQHPGHHLNLVAATSTTSSAGAIGRPLTSYSRDILNTVKSTSRDDSYNPTSKYLPSSRAFTSNYADNYISSLDNNTEHKYYHLDDGAAFRTGSSSSAPLAESLLNSDERRTTGSKRITGELIKDFTHNPDTLLPTNSALYRPSSLAGAATTDYLAHSSSSILKRPIYTPIGGNLLHHYPTTSGASATKGADLYYPSSRPEPHQQQHDNELSEAIDKLNSTLAAATAAGATTGPILSSASRDYGAELSAASKSALYSTGSLNERPTRSERLDFLTSSLAKDPFKSDFGLDTGELLRTSSTTAAATSTPTKASLTTAPRVQDNQQRYSSATTATGTNSANNNGTNLIRQLFDDMRQIEDTVDSIEIPARGRCRVFMAKYGYDPFKQSPNDNPDAELAFNAGDYIMVFDDIDEDGYFIGELMDGRRGYVPSNWLDRLTGEDLLDFQANVLYKQAGVGQSQPQQQQQNQQMGGQAKSAAAALLNANLLLDDDALDGATFPPEFYDALISDTMNHSNFQHLLAPEDYHRMNDYVDLDDVNEVDDECLSDYERAEAEQMRRSVPPPQRLVLERQLNKCILIAWLHPQSAKGTIVSYQVYVDGVLKSTVPSGDRTKALLEGVDSNIPHRISVRAIDVNGRHSNDAGCTIVIGQKIPFAPSCVKASHITSDSALISWLPCNSNFHHVVAVNSVEVQTVRPGVYKHLINGLSANTLYRVWVRAKPGKILSIDEKNPKKLESLTTYVDFKTMPKSLPDPPVNVQVEAGPQRRTLLVTWLPLTLNDFGSSNGCAVTGYAVFAGHKKLADIDSPTGDHALLDICDLESLHKKSVTVRTKSGENLSQDSMPCHIPDEYLKTGGQPAGASHAHGQGRLGQAQANMSHSPSRQRMASTNSATASRQHQLGGGGAGAARLTGSARYAAVGGRHGRPLARSLQNLESDLDSSRRSSIPAIEITRETSGSEMLNQTESYSEEEFESSMRFRGGPHARAKTGGSRLSGGARQFRARQSHSVEGSAPHVRGPLSSLHQHQDQQQAQMHGSRHYQSQASLAGGQQRLRSATPMGDVRYFVALFDYDPSTMSPNPNAAAEELAFKEGSIIKVHGGLGEDGFFKGEIDGQTGFVPSNVITEITDPNLLQSLYEKQNPSVAFQQQQRHQQQVAQMQQHQQQLPLVDPTKQLGQQAQQQQYSQGGAVKRMVALYDYDPQENSPNADTESEIPFKTGDVIFVYGKMDTDGFYMGEVERTKQRGLVPSNFLREEPLASKQQQQQQFKQTNPNGPMQQQHAQANGQRQQQQQRLNQQQFNQQANMPMQMQQPMDMSGGAMGAAQMQMQMQPQLRGPTVRGPQQQSLAMGSQQNINRPNSLSLTAMNSQQMVAMNLQNQQQMQSQQAMPSAPMMQPQQQQQAGAVAMGNQVPMNSQFGPNQTLNRGGPLMMGSQQQPSGPMMSTQQQQQQQPTGGVLSNLLSSGKQIIGAATTPRVPHQPGGFQNPNLSMGPVSTNPMGQSANSMMHQQPQMNQMDADFNRQPTSQQQQQGLAGFGHQFGADFGQQQLGGGVGLQNSFQMNQMGASGGADLTGHQQSQQQYNQAGNFSRSAGVGGAGTANTSQMGDDQGGNILNTVKNMFKL